MPPKTKIIDGTSVKAVKKEKNMLHNSFKFIYQNPFDASMEVCLDS
jgi:hypothetical protein